MTRGTLPIQRRFGKLGELRVASGTKDPELKAHLDEMLTVLNESRRDVLRAIIDKRLTVLHVWSAYRVGRLAELPLTPEEMMPLAPAMEAWKERLKNRHGEPASAKHRVSIQLSVNRLARHAATVGDLPAAVTAVRDELLPAHKRTYQLVRVHALGFLRDLAGIGRYHQLYFDVANVPDVLVRAKRQAGLSITGFRERVAQLDARTQAEAWAMAGTGMRPGEYLGERFEVVGDVVRIAGTKTERAVRVAPCTAPVRGPFRQYKAMRAALARGGLKPHTLRRCYAHWCEQAGIPLSRIQAYLGHASSGRGAGVTGLYLEAELAEYLAVDHAKLAAYVGPVDLGLRLEARA